jgi:hypothetical protein
MDKYWILQESITTCFSKEYQQPRKTNTGGGIAEKAKDDT